MKLKEKLLQNLNESSKDDRKSVADFFTRYVMGEKNMAMSGLTKANPASLGLDINHADASEFNKQYKKLYNLFLKVIEGEV